MHTEVVVTVSVIEGLLSSFAWWGEDNHLALRATCAHDLPDALEAAAAAIRDTANRS